MFWGHLATYHAMPCHTMPCHARYQRFRSLVVAVKIAGTRLGDFSRLLEQVSVFVEQAERGTVTGILLFLGQIPAKIIN